MLRLPHAGRSNPMSTPWWRCGETRSSRTRTRRARRSANGVPAYVTTTWHAGYRIHVTESSKLVTGRSVGFRSLRGAAFFALRLTALPKYKAVHAHVFTAGPGGPGCR